MCREREYAQALLDIDEIARGRGERFGICDCVDNEGNPYPSGWLEGLLSEAKITLKLVSTKNGKFLDPKWSTAFQWKNRKEVP